MIKKISTGSLGLQQGSHMMFSDFGDGGAMWTGTGPRERRHRIRFAETFAEAPIVTTSISMWDVAQETAMRADLQAEHVSEQGFDLVFRTWSDTRVARIRADWVAIGAMPDDDLWDVD